MVLGFRVVRSSCLCCDQCRDIFSVLIEVLIRFLELPDGERRGRELFVDQFVEFVVMGR